jgi:hypothetical protein
MTKAWKIVWALATALVAGQSALAQPETPPDNIVPAVGRARAISAPQMPSDDPTPFAPSPFLSREFAPDLPSRFPEYAPPPNSGAPPMPEAPVGPRRILPYVDVEIGYALVMYKKQATSFPTLTLGNASDPIPGAAGSPDTFWLFNRPGGNESPLNGGRARIVTWLPDLEALSLEVVATIPEPQTLSVVTLSGNYPGQAISRPFFNPNSGVHEAFPVAVPNIFSSVSTDAFKTRFYGGEANVRWNYVNNISGILGFRYLRVDESYYNQDNITSLIDGSVSVFKDNFTTLNRFAGPQIGILYNTGKGLVEFDFFGKCALGVNRQTATISGLTVFTDPLTGAQFVDPTKGTYAQPTNIGEYRKSNISAVPEVGVNLRLAVGPRCKVAISYSALWFTNMIRPGDQMDYIVNPQALAGTVTPPLFPTPPTFRHTEFWMQTVSFGLEYLF